MTPRRRAFLAGIIIGALALCILFQRLLACAWEPFPSVRFDGQFYRMGVAHGPWSDAPDPAVDEYFARFREAIGEARAAALPRPERRILTSDIDAARAIEASGDISAAARAFEEIQRRAQAAYREHRAAGDVITYALSIAQDRLDLYAHRGQVGTDTLLQYAAARDRYDAGDPDGALAALSELSHRTDAPALEDQIGYLRAAIDLRAGRADAARASFHQLAEKLGKSPRAAVALYQEARLALAAGQSETAEKLLQTLLERYPRHALADDALGDLGALARERGDLPAVISSYDRILHEYPDGDMTARARESLLTLGDDALARKDDKKLKPYLPFYTAYFALRPDPVTGLSATAAELEPVLLALDEAAAGPFMASEARYRKGALLEAAGQHERAAAVFAECARDPDPSIAARSLYMKGRLGDRQALQTLVDTYPIHSTADDALCLLAPSGAEGVRLLHAVLSAYPHRDHVITAARAIVARTREVDPASAPSVEEQILAALRDAGHEDRWLFAQGAGVSYLPLMSRYPESPLALDGFFRQCYLTVRHREDVLAPLVPSQDIWASRVSPFRDEGTAPDAATPKDRDAETVEEARAILRFARGFLGRGKGGSEIHGNSRSVGNERRAAERLVELQVPMALYILGQLEEALGKAQALLESSPQDTLADEAAFARVLALVDLGRPEEAVQAARDLRRDFPNSAYATLAREREAILEEDMGHRVEALRLYLELGYAADVRYFIDVLMTDEDLSEFLRLYPDDPAADLVRHARAVRTLRGNDPVAARPDLEASAARAPEGGRAPEEEDISLWNPVAPYPPPPAALIAQDGREKIEVLGELETPIELALPDDERAEALYRAGVFLFRHDFSFYCEPVWRGMRVEILKLLGMRREAEAKRFMAYLLAHNAKLRARAVFQDLTRRYPTSPAAPKALYMEALCDTALRSYSSLDSAWFGRISDDAPRVFASIAQRYPDSQLADDGLYWAAKLSPDPAERERIWEELRQKYPDGDAVKNLATSTNL